MFATVKKGEEGGVYHFLVFYYLVISQILSGAFCYLCHTACTFYTFVLLSVLLSLDC